MINKTFYYSEPYQTSEKDIFIYEPSESLTTWGIFISSLLLSCGAFLSQIISTFHKSKCSNINCLGMNCIRKVPNEDNV